MTNKERQVKLDKKKWQISQICGKDMSGRMEYCYYCTFQSQTKTCSQLQADKEELSSCAVAYNKMSRSK